jgi:hypothetical protein
LLAVEDDEGAAFADVLGDIADGERGKQDESDLRLLYIYK